MNFSYAEIALMHRNHIIAADYQRALDGFFENIEAASIISDRNAHIAHLNAEAARAASRKASDLSVMLDHLSIENAELRSELSRVENERNETAALLKKLLDFIET